MCKCADKTCVCNRTSPAPAEPALPADWAIRKALLSDRMTGSAIDRTITNIKISPSAAYYRTLVSLARYIEKYEEPPVAPELIAAREYQASRAATSGYEKCSLAGACDDHVPVQSFLAGVKWARENPA
jgi:hypothetical protein